MADGASEVIFLPPRGGRSYQAGPMHAVFKADGAETPAIVDYFAE